MKTTSATSLNLNGPQLREMVSRAVINLRDAPHRQYNHVIGAVFQSAREGGKLVPGAQALTDRDHQQIKDILNELARTGLILPGLGDPRSSAQDFPFFRVTDKMFTPLKPKKTRKPPVQTAQEVGADTVLHTTFQTYTLRKMLGQGGVGIVWEATDENGEKCAIKILRPSASSSKTKRFKNELNFCRSNRHPNIITVQDHGVGGAHHQKFYVMRVLSGSLRQVMSRAMSSSEKIKYIEQILQGVEAAHLQEVVHRDIKPENILYDQNADRLLLADFGVAEFSEEDLHTLVETSPNERLANFQYAAPEQRGRGKTVDRRADIFAVGLIINEWFTGEIPQGAGYKKIGVVDPAFAWLDEVVDTMIQHEPSKRFADIAQVKHAMNLRREEQIAKQRLDALTHEVVLTGEITNPLADREPKIIDADYAAGQLSVTLDLAIDAKYIHAFRSSYSRSSVWGKGPESFEWRGSTAIAGVENAEEALRLLEYFRTWLPMVKSIYRQSLEKDQRQQEEQERLRVEREKRVIADQQHFRKSVRL